MYLIQERELKSKRFGYFFSRFPSLDALDQLISHCLTAGFVFLTMGIVTGSLWARQAWGTYWHWDPKETWSLITFFAYLALVHARFAGWLNVFGSAVWNIICFLSVVMTYYGVNFILGTGMHSYGSGSGGLTFVVTYLLVECTIIGGATWRYCSMEGRHAKSSRAMGSPTMGL